MSGPWKRFAPHDAMPGPWTRFQKATPAAPAPNMPAPPPGAIIHGGDGRSYFANQPEISVERTAEPGTREAALEMQALAARGRTDGALSDVARVARPFAQGQSFNLSDELISAVFAGTDMLRGGSPADAYAYAQEFQRQELERQRTEAPLTSAAAEMGGAFMTGAAAAPKVFATGGGLLANSARGAVAGSAGGAVSGFGAGDGLDDRLDQAGTGAVIGAGVGAAVPVAAASIGAGVRAVRNAHAARQTLPAAGIGRRTADQITRELDRDGLAVEAARDRLNAMGPDAMLLDLGDNIAGGADAVANQPGTGQRLLRGRLAERTASAPARITAAADTALGQQRNIAETVDDLIARRAAESAPAYERALNRPIGWNERLQAFLDDPIARRGLRQGVEIQRLEALARNERFDPLDFNITGFNEAGDPIITGTPNMRTLNVIKKGLDDVIESYRDPVTGRLALDERGRAVNEVQRAFINELDSINPDYAEARRLWAGPTRVREALGLGQDVFNRSVRPDQLRQRLAAMSDDEREAFRIGARDQLAEVMGTARRDATAARALFETGWNREKLGLVLGDDAAATTFLDTLGTETAFANRANTIVGNSATARRLERAGEYNGQRSAARAAFDPASGMWGDVKRLGAKAVDAVLDGRAARSAEQMRGEFGEAVSRQGAERDELMDAIMGYGEAWQRAGEASVRDEELIRAILFGGGQAIAGQVP